MISPVALLVRTRATATGRGTLRNPSSSTGPSKLSSWRASYWATSSSRADWACNELSVDGAGLLAMAPPHISGIYGSSSSGSDTSSLASAAYTMFSSADSSSNLVKIQPQQGKLSRESTSVKSVLSSRRPSFMSSNLEAASARSRIGESPCE